MKLIENSGLKAESEKRCLGSAIKMKLCRLEMSTAEGSKSYLLRKFPWNVNT